MDDENKAYLDTVLKNCQNNSQLFLTTVATYLRNKTDFFSGDYQRILSETFANAAKSLVDEQPQKGTVKRSSDTNNGETNAPDLHNDNSSDLFDDEVIPETQYIDTPHDESNDSGESICIPFYDKSKGSESPSKDAEHSDNDSEFVQIHPESNVTETIPDQSQLLLANIDQSLILGLETTFTSKEKNTSAQTSARAAASIEANAENVNDDEKYEASDNGRYVDRSGSTTPDLDFVCDLNGKEQAAKPQENDRDNDETQMLSESIFDACTQLVNPVVTPKQTSTEDIFGAVTQQVPIFKHPGTISSTPRVLPKPKKLIIDDSIFEASTQRMSDDEEDIFEQATQILPSRKSSSAQKSTKSSHYDQCEPEKSVDHEKSDELFEMETQLFEPPELARPIPHAHQDLNETDIFDMATQIVDEPGEPANVKRIVTVMTQSSQPANTPEWSVAARLSIEEIDRFEKERAEREAEKKKQKLKKHRFLFSTSSSEEDDEDDDDLEFDLPKPTERISVGRSKQIEREDERPEIRPSDSLKRPSSENVVKEVPSKKLKPDSTQKTLSVKVSRDEVTRHMQIEAQTKARKSSRETNKVTKAVIETNHAKSNDSENRNLRQRKTEQEKEVRQSKRNKQVDTDKSPQRERKRQDEEKTTKSNASHKFKTAETKTRNAKKGKAQENGTSPPMQQVVTSTSSIDSHASSMKRRHSDRPSTRQSSRYGILFTKVKPTPYIKLIENLGGFIVDTPQIGNILICDKISRTFKFLYALAKGIPIVTPHWLDMSAKNGAFESIEPYLIVDKVAEKRFNFSLKKSLESAKQTPLFADYHIFATPNVQPTMDEISEIVECSGGKFASSPSMKRKAHSKAVLVSHTKDRKLWPAYQEAHPDIQIVGSEGFLQSVVQQKINFPQYILR